MPLEIDLHTRQDSIPGVCGPEGEMVPCPQKEMLTGRAGAVALSFPNSPSVGQIHPAPIAITDPSLSVSVYSSFPTGWLDQAWHGLNQGSPL